MEPEMVVVIPPQRVVEVAVVQPPCEDMVQHNVALATPTREQVQACDGVFTQQQEESHLVAGLIGMWSSVLLMHDLTAEHFGRAREEEKPLLQEPKLPAE
jgi:hypothetical protein